MKNDLTILFLSSYSPRKCGMATFTQSLSQVLEKNHNVSIKIASINDRGKRYDYDKKVIAIIKEDKIDTYHKAAETINSDPDIDIVSLQHVFSLFGGENGEHIIKLLKNLKKPVFTTLHMVYSQKKQPAKHEVVDKNYIELTKQIYKYSEKIIVLIQPMKDILVEEYGFDENKIIVVPHGSPIEKYDQKTTARLRKKYGYEKNKIISTFGLIRPKKGLEYIIQAMPKILEKYPETLFLILGTSHPNRPESYYKLLQKETKRLGLESSIIFKNNFLSFKEIIEHLILTDAFITPYLVPEQTSSGVMAYAMGCGKAIISTGFLYAQEVLAEKRGLFINYRNPESIFLAVDFLFKYPEKRKRMERLTFQYAKDNSWPKIANEYVNIFHNYKESKSLATIPRSHRGTRSKTKKESKQIM